MIEGMFRKTAVLTGLAGIVGCASVPHVEHAVNLPPLFSETTEPAEEGLPDGTYLGYFQVSDPDGDKIEVEGTHEKMSSPAPDIEDVKIKRILGGRYWRFSASIDTCKKKEAGEFFFYRFHLIAEDQHGATAQKSYDIRLLCPEEK